MRYEAAVTSGGRTATLAALTAGKVAVVPGHAIDRGALERLAKGRRGEVE